MDMLYYSKYYFYNDSFYFKYDNNKLPFWFLKYLH